MGGTLCKIIVFVKYAEVKDLTNIMLGHGVAGDISPLFVFRSSLSFTLLPSATPKTHCSVKLIINPCSVMLASRIFGTKQRNCEFSCFCQGDYSSLC